MAQNVSRSTTINTQVSFTLPATDNNSLTYRIVKQPSHGRIGVSGSTATYYPNNAFEGVDTFTFAAWDNMRNSNLGIGTITVSGGSCAYTLTPSNRSHNELSQAGNLQISTGSTCEWTAASETHWLSIISPAAQVAGPGSVTYAVARNTGASPRTGTLHIAGKSFTVNQSGAPLDLNGDGLPDSWQELYFTLATNPEAAPGADPDMDGVSNIDEYRSATEPDNTDSVLKITSFGLNHNDALFNLTFPSLSIFLYQVQKTADLISPDWQGYTNAVTGTGASLPQTGPVIAEDDQMFYRVLLVD